MKPWAYSDKSDPCHRPFPRLDALEVDHIKPPERRDHPCERHTTPAPQGENGARYRVYARHDQEQGATRVRMNSGKDLTFQPTTPTRLGKTVKEEFPNEDYPNVDGLPIRGKEFTANEENPKYEELGSSPLNKKAPKGGVGSRARRAAYSRWIANIKAYENEHKPKPEPFKLDELTSSDYYNKVYVNEGGAVRYNDINIEQIKLYPLTAVLWLEYRRIEGAYHEIQYNALRAETRATVYRPQSKFPFFHDSLIQLRSQIKKITGLPYKTVERGLNHMLKKRIINDLRGTRAYSLDLECIWNRTNLWHEDCERIINARKADGPDWIKKDVFEWQEYGDFKWQHARAYCKEHQTII